jgi:hypothetical protein
MPWPGLPGGAFITLSRSIRYPAPGGTEGRHFGPPGAGKSPQRAGRGKQPGARCGYSLRKGTGSPQRSLVQGVSAGRGMWLEAE